MTGIFRRERNNDEIFDGDERTGADGNARVSAGCSTR